MLVTDEDVLVRRKVVVPAADGLSDPPHAWQENRFKFGTPEASALLAAWAVLKLKAPLKPRNPEPCVKMGLEGKMSFTCIEHCKQWLQHLFKNNEIRMTLTSCSGTVMFLEVKDAIYKMLVLSDGMENKYATIQWKRYTDEMSELFEPADMDQLVDRISHMVPLIPDSCL